MQDNDNEYNIAMGITLGFAYNYLIYTIQMSLLQYILFK